MKLPINCSSLLMLLLLLSEACTTNTVSSSKNQDAAEKACRQSLQTLLESIEQKDLPALKNTLSPQGEIEWILSDRAPSYTAKEFIEFHEAWFQDTAWTMETDILNLSTSGNLCLATTSALYKEPERNGKPYFNKMIVSYVLEENNNQWYVIKDQANSIEKSK